MKISKHLNIIYSEVGHNLFRYKSGKDNDHYQFEINFEVHR
jgi:hypothetical protein